MHKLYFISYNLQASKQRILKNEEKIINEEA